MSDDKVLFVVGGGDGIEKQGNSYFRKKQSTKEYVERLRDRVPDFRLLTIEYPDDGLDTELLQLDLSTPSVWTQTRGSIGAVVQDFLSNCRNVFGLRDKDVTTLVFLPGFFGYIYGLLAFPFTDQLILYYGFDTRKILEDTGPANLPRLLCYPLFDWVLLSKASVVLYRDRETDLRTSTDDTRFIRSHPISGFSTGDIYEREDTCQDEPVELLYVGSLAERKGVGYLIDAMEKLDKADDTPALHLRVVGDGPRREPLAEKVRDCGLTDFVTFEGYVSEKRELLAMYREADLFVLPTLGEGFPRVLTEALSQGLPIVVTDAGEIGHRLSNNEATFVSSKDPDALTEGIRSLLSDKERRRTQIAAGLDTATELLSSDAAEQHASIIQELWKSSGDAVD